jgi:copper chaperone CopZ
MDIIKITALLSLATCLAQAAEPIVITLTCEGTVKTNVGNNEGQRKAINKVGVVVDLPEQTVSFEGYVAHIENVDAAIVFFGAGEDHATGEIDRASGLMSATAVKGNLATSYELLCKPVTPSASRKTK